MRKNLKEYFWKNNKADNSYLYLFNSIRRICEIYDTSTSSHLDVGCGNGYMTKKISRFFKHTTAIDPSNSAIIQAKKKYKSKIQFYKQKVSKIKRKYDFVTLIEVIEHVYSPDDLLNSLKLITNKNSRILITTPYHGFIKNLLIIISGKFDLHFSPLWEHGHIKFFSLDTLKKLVLRNNYQIERFFYSGRIFPISKSIIFIIKKK